MPRVHRRHLLIRGSDDRRDRSTRGDGPGGADGLGPAAGPDPGRWPSPRRCPRRPPCRLATRGRPPGRHVHLRRPPRPEPLAMAPDAVQAASPGAFPRLCRGVQRVAAGRGPLRPRTDPGGQRTGRPHGLLPLRLRRRHVAAQPPGTRQAGRRSPPRSPPPSSRSWSSGRPRHARAARHRSVAAVHRSWPSSARGTFPVPAERVVIGPSIAYGMTGVEVGRLIYPRQLSNLGSGGCGRSRSAGAAGFDAGGLSGSAVGRRRGR